MVLHRSNSPLPIPNDQLDSIGEPISPQQPHHTWISAINTNGIRLDNVSQNFQFALDADIDIQCYSEINLDTMQRPVKQALKDGLASNDTKGTATWSSSNIPSTNSFKLGGQELSISIKFADVSKNMVQTLLADGLTISTTVEAATCSF